MYGIEPIKSYAEAVKYWENTKPIRGRKEDVRPIGWRSYTHNTIAKGNKGEIVCTFNNQPTVTFYKDGRVDIKNFSYNTVSTTYFLDSLFTWHKLRAYIYDHSLVLNLSGHERRVQPDSTITLQMDEAGNYHFVKDAVNYTHKINRKETNNVRAKFDDFRAYVSGLLKLRGDEAYRREELENVLGEDKGTDLNNLQHSWQANERAETLKRFNKYITDKSADRHNNYYKAVLMLIYSYGRYEWNSRGYVASYETIMDGLNTILVGLYRDKCLKSTPTDKNVVKRDIYGKYFSGAWAKFHGDK